MTLKALRRYRWCNGAPWFETITSGEPEAQHAEYGGLVYKAAAVRRLVAALDRPEVCICAAIKFADGRVVRGHRHDSCLHTAARWTPKPALLGHVQGFITSSNRFVGREEAMCLQTKASVLTPSGRMPRGAVLFSEDLY